MNDLGAISKLAESDGKGPFHGFCLRPHRNPLSD
jgi:hypothetical protein